MYITDKGKNTKNIFILDIPKNRFCQNLSKNEKQLCSEVFSMSKSKQPETRLRIRLQR